MYEENLIYTTEYYLSIGNKKNYAILLWIKLKG